MQKIFIVEDDDNIRELVCYALESSGFEPSGFAEPSGLWQALRGGTCPALLVLDIMLPQEDGMSILKKLRQSEKTRQLPIIMLTAKGAEHDRIRGLDLGADDYMTKPFSVMELLSRVKAVLRRSGSLQDEAEELAAGGIVLHLKRHSVTANGQDVVLTLKEFELLHHLMRSAGMVLSRDQLMEQVWGFYYEGESRTIDVHINSLRQKLGDCGNAIKTVRGIGYKLEENS